MFKNSQTQNICRVCYAAIYTAIPTPLCKTNYSNIFYLKIKGKKKL